MSVRDKAPVGSLVSGDSFPHSLSSSRKADLPKATKGGLRMGHYESSTHHTDPEVEQATRSATQGARRGTKNTPQHPNTPHPYSQTTTSSLPRSIR